MAPDNLIAHRGWRHRYPENTLIAIEQAIAVGARHIETDILMTKDQHLVLCHDEHLQRLCGIDRCVSQLSWEQLSQYSPCEPERLGEEFRGVSFSLLEDTLALLAQHSDVQLYVEVKEEALGCFGHSLVAEKLLAQIAHHKEQCVVISFDPDILQMIKSRGFHRVGLVLTDWAQWPSPALTALDPVVVFCDDDIIDDDRDLSDTPFALAVYEVDNMDRARQLWARGVKYIETFAIGEMLDAL